MKRKRASRTVLITGATGGIGSEIVMRFAENGWNIICHYNSSQKKVGRLKKVLEKYGIDFYFSRSDFSSKSQVLRFINKIQKFNIDSLVNNAGTYIISRHFSELNFSDITKTFMVNTFAPVMIASQLFMRMKQRRFGRIVNMSSVAAKYGGSSHSVHYGCSKLAVEGLTKTLAREGARYNVLVNTVRPGVIDTEFHNRFPKDMRKRINMIPLKRMGRPRDIADIVYYLGSDANSYITNEIIAVAGGE